MNFREVLPALKFTDAPSGEIVIQHITDTWLKKESASIVHFIYYATYVLLEKDESLQKSMLLADHLLIDGIGMQTYCHILTGHTPHNLNGTDLGPLWINYLVKTGIPICLYGTSAENIQKAADQIKTQYGNSVLAYFQDGYSPLHWNNIPIGAVLFVGLGTPKQENWVRENIDVIRDKKLLVITVGGFFDFLSGYYVRAPEWVRNIKLEWAWRTILHPGRHLKKRVRDTTIFYKPYADKRKGYDKLLIINHLS